MLYLPRLESQKSMLLRTNVQHKRSSLRKIKNKNSITRYEIVNLIRFMKYELACRRQNVIVVVQKLLLRIHNEGNNNNNKR